MRGPVTSRYAFTADGRPSVRKKEENQQQPHRHRKKVQIFSRLISFFSYPPLVFRIDEMSVCCRDSTSLWPLHRLALIRLAVRHAEACERVEIYVFLSASFFFFSSFFQFSLVLSAQRFSDTGVRKIFPTLVKPAHSYNIQVGSSIFIRIPDHTLHLYAGLNAERLNV